MPGDIKAPYGEKSVEEKSVVRNLLYALMEQNGLRFDIEKLQPLDPDPPDVLITCKNGRRIGVEAREFVNEKYRKAHQEKKPVMRKLYTMETFQKELRSILSDKNEKLGKSAHKLSETWLCIYSDELMLPDNIVEKTVCDEEFGAYTNIDRAFFMKPPLQSLKGIPENAGYDDFEEPSCQLWEISLKV